MINSNFVIPISMQPDGVKLLFDRSHSLKDQGFKDMGLKNPICGKNSVCPF